MGVLMSEIKLTEHAVLKNVGNVPYVSFPILEQFPYVRHGFSTRLGGVSSGIFESMNLGFLRGDYEDLVMENYERICQSIGIEVDNLVFTDQVHKSNVRVATASDRGMGIKKERKFKEIDGQITNESEVSLLAFSADCVPLFFLDPVNKAIGLTHSGWRGTVSKIGKVTVEQMVKEYGSKAEDILVVIGPCICKDCYEVSEDVAKEFMTHFTKEQYEKILYPQAEISEQGQKYQLDLWEANHQLLIEAGVASEHIVKSGLCTMCRQDLFFSHRGSKGRRGSLAGFMSLSLPDSHKGE